MKLTSTSVISIISTSVGTAVAGPVGGVIGNLAGGLFQHIFSGIPGFTSDVLKDILKSVASEKLTQVGTNFFSRLNHEEKLIINHDLQIAFRDAFREAVFDIGGKTCFPKAWLNKRIDVPNRVIFPNTTEWKHLWYENPLAKQVCDCLHDFIGALENETLLPLYPPSNQIYTSVNPYVEAYTPGKLNDAFFDQVVHQFLKKYSSLVIELPDFEKHLRLHLLDRTLVHLKECIKERTPAWRAFNRLLLESMRNQLGEISTGQMDITKKLDMLLEQSEKGSLAEYSDRMADLLTAIGDFEKKLDGSLDDVFSQVVAQNKAMLKRLDKILIIEVRVESKVDRVLRILEDGHFVVEGAAPVDLNEKPESGKAPFKGLQYYTVNNADYFFGREILTAKIVNRLNCERFLAVIGASGSGKSSIVRAGVVPALQNGELLQNRTTPPKGSEEWLIHIITPTNNPLEALASSLTRDNESVTMTAVLADSLANDSRALNLYTRKLLSNNNQKNEDHLLLIIDQFEEVFTACKNEDMRQAFIANLLEAVDNGIITIIIVLRADFYGNCARYAGLPKILEKHQAYIEAMSPEEMRQAIEQSASIGNWQFERGLVDIILRDMENEPGALPLLSHALLETWKHRRGRTMTFESYAESGGVRGAIAKTAETVYTQKLTPEQQKIARSIFIRLTELGEGVQDTRRRAKLEELVPQPEQVENVKAVLELLVDARLVTTKKDTADVAHEALIREWPTLREWLEEDREGLRIHRHLTEAVQEWDSRGRDNSDLYRGTRLEQASEWKKKNTGSLNPHESQFIEKSLSLQEKERRFQRRRRQLLAILGSFLIIFFATAAFIFNRQAKENKSLADAANVASTLAFNQKVAAEEQAHLARIGELTGISRQNMATKLDLAMLLGIKTYDSINNFQTRGNLLELNLYTPRLSQIYWHSTNFKDWHSNGVLSVAFSPDGKIFATGGQDQKIILWDLETNEPIGEPLSDNLGWIKDLVFSPDGKILASGDSFGKIILWDVVSRQPKGDMLSEGDDQVYSLDFSPDGKILASASGLEQRIILWNVENKKAIAELFIENPKSIEWLYTVKFSPNGKILASGGSESTITLWDLASQQPIGEPLKGHSAWVKSIDFSPDGKILASAGYDNSIVLWNVASQQPIGEPLEGHSDKINSIAFSPDGKILASGSDDDTIILWNMDTYQPLEAPLLFHSDYIFDLEFNPDGKFLAAGMNKEQITIWDVSDKNILGDSYVKNVMFKNFVFSPFGNTMAYTDNDNKIIVQDFESGKNLGETINVHSDFITTIAYSQDGTILASGSFDGSIILYDTPNLQMRGELMLGHTKTLSFSPDGKTLASGGYDNAIILWDVASGQQLGLLQVHSDWVNNLAFSPDGRILASGSDDNTIILWDMKTKKVKYPPLVEHTRPINTLAFSPDGKILASGSSDRSVILWDVESGNPIGSPLTDNIGRVKDVTFSPDGKTLAAAGNDSKIYFWDVESHQLLGDPLISTSDYIIFTADGKKLISFGWFYDDSTLAIWDMDPQSWRDRLCQIVGRNFFQQEWTTYFPNEPYSKTCEQWSEGN